jgi:hypothetical protein
MTKPIKVSTDISTSKIETDQFKILDKCYPLVRELEIVLRSFIASELQRENGTKWWRQCIPELIRKRVRDNRNKDLKIGWDRFVSLPLIYYTGFGDLASIMEVGNNWKSCFGPRFSKNQQVITGAVRTVDKVRNKIAHNRPATSNDENDLQYLKDLLLSDLGEDEFGKHLGNFEKYPNIPQVLKGIVIDLRAAVDPVTDDKMLLVPKSEHYDQARSADWWNSEYLGFKVDDIDKCFVKIHEYNRLPRDRGDGSSMQRWVNETSIVKTLTCGAQFIDDNLTQ